MPMVHFIPPSSRRLAALAASLDQTPVFIEGEVGTGRAAIAAWIHRNSARAGYPFEVLKITADSTEAQFEEALKKADGGSLLVENIELFNKSQTQSGPQLGQAFLHYLKSSGVTGVNTGIERLLSTRIFATSLLPLEHLSQAQGDRTWVSLLQEIQIRMPSLRSRRHEFEDLALGILSELAHSLKLDHIKKFEPKAMLALQAYEWPGNLRELRNILRAAINTIAHSGSVITWESLPPDFTQGFERYQSNRQVFETLLHFPKN